MIAGDTPGPGSAADPETGGAHLLLVEDNLGDALLLTHSLEDGGGPGFVVDHVTRLEDAREYLEHTKVGAVLLDLSLPDSHGIETLVALSECCPDTPIIVVTGLEDPDLSDSVRQRGAVSCLFKNQIDWSGLPHRILETLAPPTSRSADTVESGPAGTILREVVATLEDELPAEARIKLREGSGDEILVSVRTLRAVAKRVLRCALGSASGRRVDLTVRVLSATHDLILAMELTAGGFDPRRFYTRLSEAEPVIPVGLRFAGSIVCIEVPLGVTAGPGPA